MLKIISYILCSAASAVFAVIIGRAAGKEDETEMKRIGIYFAWFWYGILIGILTGLQIEF